jgi:hypothetical protein
MHLRGAAAERGGQQRACGLALLIAYGVLASILFLAAARGQQAAAMLLMSTILMSAAKE